MASTKKKPARRSSSAKANSKASSRRAEKQQSRDARMEEVIEAATEMFYERGYEGTSIENVANAVGILKGSLYYYIDSKEDLLFRVVDQVQRDIHSMLDDAIAAEDTPPLDRLSEFARRQVEYNARNVKIVAVYHNDWRRLKGDRLADITRRRKYESRVVLELLEEAKQRGDIAETLDTKLAASCVFATIIWPHAWYRAGGVDPERLASFYASFILRGVTGAG
ncbi:MAG TPA: TetR/AcrR family transcriptional regulator [Solirubrobacterales bacterium]|nr:TetR/AcrR family transcriptional regulator [Solirubrobacterales bacterium]